MEDAPAALVVVDEFGRVGDQIGGMVDQLRCRKQISGGCPGAGEVLAQRARGELDLFEQLACAPEQLTYPASLGPAACQSFAMIPMTLAEQVGELGVR